MQGQFSHLCRCCWVSKTHTEESLVAVTRFLVSVYSNHGSCSFQGQRSHCLQTDRNYTRHGVAQSQNIHNNCDFRGCILNVSGPPHISRRRSKDPNQTGNVCIVNFTGLKLFTIPRMLITCNGKDSQAHPSSSDMPSYQNRRVVIFCTLTYKTDKFKLYTAI